MEGHQTETSKFEIQKKGTESVGGRQMSYFMGTTTDSKTGKQSRSFIGVFPVLANRLVLIYGVHQVDSEQYDLPATEKLLQDIDSI